MTGPGGAPPAGEVQVPEPTAVDAGRPNIARAYDYLLGGKANYAADRAETACLIEVFPLLPVRARQNRLFLARAVTWLAGQGSRQFVDIGRGLPTANNTHQLARAAYPDCRVAYVDQDPVMVSHARALLSGTGAIALQGDLADPDAILADPVLQRLITLAEPAAVILAMVLYFIGYYEDALWDHRQIPRPHGTRQPPGHLARQPGRRRPGDPCRGHPRPTRARGCCCAQVARSDHGVPVSQILAWAPADGADGFTDEHCSPAPRSCYRWNSLSSQKPTGSASHMCPTTTESARRVNHPERCSARRPVPISGHSSVGR